MGKLAETILNILWYLNNAHMDFIYDDFSITLNLGSFGCSVKNSSRPPSKN